jgi:hypothetical protein
VSILGTKEIKELAREIVLSHPEGIRFKDIVAKIVAKHPDATNRTTIEAQVANYLVPAYPAEISKPTRGLYIPVGSAVAAAAPAALPILHRAEEEFYEPFARYLHNDLEEATAAVTLGGATFKSKWGTPDVIGVYRPLTHDLVKFTP